MVCQNRGIYGGMYRFLGPSWVLITMVWPRNRRMRGHRFLLDEPDLSRQIDLLPILYDVYRSSSYCQVGTRIICVRKHTHVFLGWDLHYHADLAQPVTTAGDELYDLEHDLR